MGAEPANGEVVDLQDFLSQLRVKDVTVFELLEGTDARDVLTYDAFLFFPRVGAYLGREAGLSGADGRDLGQLSELVYLYARLHGSVGETGGRGDQLKVLLGDLFLGRFYETLSASGKEACLPVYIEFMRRLNSGGIDALTGGAARGARELLLETTAEAAAILAQPAPGTERDAAARLKALARGAEARLRPADAELPVPDLETLAARLEMEEC